MLRDEKVASGRASRLLLALVALVGCGMVLFVWRAQARRRPTQSVAGIYTGDAFVYAVETPGVTSYWLGNADRPAIRTLLQGIPHTQGWSGKAALSPDDRVLAYTRLPGGESEPDTNSELWTIGLSERRPIRIAEAVDLRSALVWSRILPPSLSSASQMADRRFGGSGSTEGRRSF